MGGQLQLTLLRGADLPAHPVSLPHAWLHRDRSPSDYDSYATCLPLPALQAREVLQVALPQAGFRTAEFAPTGHYAHAVEETGSSGGKVAHRARRVLEIAWMDLPDNPGWSLVEWIVYDDAIRSDPRPDPFRADRFFNALQHACQQVLRARIETPPLLGPGERIDDREAARLASAPGRLPDYSGCATAGQTAHLHSGLLWIGRYLHFGKQQPQPRPGAELYLDNVPSALILGAPGPRSSAVLHHWARHLLAAGRSVVMLSAARDLPPDFRRVGLDEFEVIPRPPLNAACSRRITGLCATLLGADAAARPARDHLSALIHLGLLRAESDPGSTLTSSVLAELLLDEQAAIACIESALRYAPPPASAGLARSARYWAAMLHSLIGPDWLPGKRDPSIPYEAATAPILHALAPFLDAPSSRRFCLDDARGGAQAIHLLIPSGAALPAAWPAIQLSLKHALHEIGPRLAVLCDDVRRLPQMDIAGFLAAARDGGGFFAAVGDAPDLAEISSQAHARIWMLPLAAHAADALNRQLGPRARQVISSEIKARQEHAVRVTAQPDSAYFHEADLKQGPGGKVPAIVTWGQDRPVLASLDPAVLTFTVGAGPDSDFGTIVEALRSVPPHARLLVRPGVYTQELEITQPVSIEADGPSGSAVIAPPEWYPIISYAALRLAGLTLQTESAYGINVHKGSLVAIGCRIGSLVQIPEGGRAALFHCVIERSGVTAFGADLLAEDCVIRAFGPEPIAVGGGTARLRRCTLEEAGKCALLVDGGNTLLEDCLLRRARFGVIAFSGSPVLRRCTIAGVQDAAVLEHHDSAVILDDCEVEGAVVKGLGH